MIEAATNDRGTQPAEMPPEHLAVVLAAVAVMLGDAAEPAGRASSAPVRLAVREAWPRISPWRYLGRL